VIPYAPGVTLTKLPDPVTAITPGAAPDSSRPLGTVLMSTFESKGAGWGLVEWDPIARTVIRRTRFDFAPSGPNSIQTGAEHAMARAGSGVVYLTTGYEEAPAYENRQDVAIDPASGAAFTNDGFWLAPNGHIERRFVPPPQMVERDTPPFPLPGVIWVRGRALVLLSNEPSDYLAIVEPLP
jgi:hypothetical protein